MQWKKSKTKYENFLHYICISRNDTEVIHERNFYNTYIQCHFSRITKDEKGRIFALHKLKVKQRNVFLGYNGFYLQKFIIDIFIEDVQWFYKCKFVHDLFNICFISNTNDILSLYLNIIKIILPNSAFYRQSIHTTGICSSVSIINMW